MIKSEDMDAKNVMEPPFAPGGSGGPYNIKLAAQAIRQRWPMSAEQRKEIVDWLLIVVACTDDARAKVNAAKALIEADKLNMEQEKRDQCIPDRIDVTSGGRPIASAAELQSLTDEELDRQIAIFEGRANPPREGESGTGEHGAGSVVGGKGP